MQGGRRAAPLRRPPSGPAGRSVDEGLDELSVRVAAHVQGLGHHGAEDEAAAVGAAPGDVVLELCGQRWGGAGGLGLRGCPRGGRGWAGAIQPTRTASCMRQRRPWQESGRHPGGCGLTVDALALLAVVRLEALQGSRQGGGRAGGRRYIGGAAVGTPACTAPTSACKRTASVPPGTLPHVVAGLVDVVGGDGAALGEHALLNGGLGHGLRRGGGEGARRGRRR